MALQNRNCAQYPSFGEILSNGGFTAELAATIQENFFSDLKAPVIRVGAAFYSW
jgi:pyruvate/2-oxoglutarate/acetoin dehydrogenase E1 component